MSDLLKALDAKLARARSIVERGELGAQKAIVLTRMGEFDPARALILELRRSSDIAQSVRLTCWIMIAEGLIYFFDGFQLQADDRMVRAQFLSKSAGDFRMLALASAWRAHIEFERSQFSNMGLSLRTAISRAAVDEHDTRARAAMVMSNASALCGDFSGATRWFHEGRQHAQMDGDRLSVDALIFNRAAQNVATVRVQHCFGEFDPPDLAALRLDIESARNLEALIGKTTRAEHLKLAHAHMLMLEKRYDDAIEELKNVDDSSKFASFNFNHSLRAIELAFCYSKVGHFQEAKDWLETVKLGFRDGLDVDVVLLIDWMVDGIRNENIEIPMNVDVGYDLVAAENSYREMCALLRKSLDSVND